MKFTVVQTRQSAKSKPMMSVVSSLWFDAGSSKVKFPRKGWLKLSANTECSAEDDWIEYSCKVIGSTNNQKDGDTLIDKKQNVTGSEDAMEMSRGTRQTKAKRIPKQTFASREFKIAPVSV